MPPSPGAAPDAPEYVLFCRGIPALVFAINLMALEPG